MTDPRPLSDPHGYLRKERRRAWVFRGVNRPRRYSWVQLAVFVGVVVILATVAVARIVAGDIDAGLSEPPRATKGRV